MSEYTVIADDAAFQAAPKVFTKKEDGTYEEVPKDGLTFEADKYYTPNEEPAPAAEPAAETETATAADAAAEPAAETETAADAAAAPAANNLPIPKEQVEAIAGAVNDYMKDKGKNTTGGRRTKRKQQKKGKSAKKGGKKHRKTSGKKSRRSSSKKSRRHGRK